MIAAGAFVYIRFVKKKKELKDGRESVPLVTVDGVPTDRKKHQSKSGLESGTDADDRGKTAEPMYKTPVPSQKVVPVTQEMILEEAQEDLKDIENLNLN
eukprot:CAMPEP_0116874208 /NCGR_PEP_ID=MMETSP0463-20121206/5647_1 /TAXON_ID=181622 /ORGANISM="Strombidinopsis sp, Strain SopsisLIS2011" /LENGTH=98 /DNA_ID=CAMNT_0004517577 /DNA_START=1103 /DNA_END=1399 /DNA_ORIENTATION=-